TKATWSSAKTILDPHLPRPDERAGQPRRETHGPGLPDERAFAGRQRRGLRVPARSGAVMPRAKRVVALAAELVRARPGQTALQTRAPVGGGAAAAHRLAEPRPRVPAHPRLARAGPGAPPIEGQRPRLERDAVPRVDRPQPEVPVLGDLELLVERT